MKAVDEAGLLADAWLQLIGVKRVIFLAEVLAIKASRYANSLTGAQRSLVGLRALRVYAKVRNLGDGASRARDRQRLSLHEHVKASGLGLT